MPVATAILVTLVVYKIALLTIGIVAERWNRDEADFLLGGRKLGPLVAAISASASSSSVWTLLGVSGYAFKYGLSAIWLFPACVSGFAQPKFSRDPIGGFHNNFVLLLLAQFKEFIQHFFIIVFKFVRWIVDYFGRRPHKAIACGLQAGEQFVLAAIDGVGKIIQVLHPAVKPMLEVFELLYG